MTTRILRHLDALVETGLVSVVTPELEKVAAQFAVAITPPMAALIDPPDANDPIAAQFVPNARELITAPEERGDPIGDAAHSPVPGIVHRYPDRVLLKLLHTCAVYCRFCFRREQVGQGDGALNEKQLAVALDYIRAHPDIWEVILSGGDPLTLSVRRLAEIIAALNAIEHVKILRIHTRVPVVAPEQVTPDLIAALRGSKCGPKPVYMLIHCNHSRELTATARAACALLADNGIVLLSQSVLLRGVNDTPEALRDLMRAFVETRIKPHYLHHPDLARGTGHFRLPIERGQELMRALRGHLSGLCQPTYILDIPGGHGKVPVGPIYLDAGEVADYRGVTHTYPPKAD
jgi:lysine 2,3-aminomutase